MDFRLLAETVKEDAMTGGMDVQPDAVREELARLLAFEGITKAAMLGDFLRFVVEETLAGRSARLKAYTIAVEALHRPEDFDPNDNPLVRVQARRLRDVLSRYYANPDNVRELRIELPVGKYVPAFVTTGNSRSAPSAAADRKPRGHVLAFAFGLLTALVLLVIGLVGWYYWNTVSQKAHHERIAAINAEHPDDAGLDAGQILPQVFVTVIDRPQPQPWFDAARYRHRIEAFAGAFGDDVVVRSPAEAARNGNVQPTYNLLFYFDPAGDVMSGVMQIWYVGDGRLLDVIELEIDAGMAGDYEAGSESSTPADLGAVRLAIERHGLIYGDLARHYAADGPLECVVDTVAFHADPTSIGHLNARSCLENAIGEHPRFALAFALLGGLYVSEYRDRLNAIPGDPLARAEAALDKATRLAPQSTAGYRNMQDLLLSRGNVSAAIAAGNEAIALNPDNMDSVAALGRLMALLGRNAQAAELLLRAQSNMSSPPQWLHYFTFLALDGLGRREAADSYASRLAGTSDALFLSAVVIAAHRAGNADLSARAAMAMIENRPTWLTNPSGVLSRHGFSGPVAERLLDSLVTAGFPSLDLTN